MTPSPKPDTTRPIVRALPRTVRWVLPPLAVMAIGFLGVLLYMGGLGSPQQNLHEFPIAVVNEDEGAQMPGPDGKQTDVQMGQEIADAIVAQGDDSDEVDFRLLSREDAEDALHRGDAYGAIVVPSDFSQRSTALISASLGGDGDGQQPVIDIVTSPQAGSMTSRLATGVMDPAVSSASSSLGEQLLSSAQSQIQQLEKADGPTPSLTTVAEGTLSDPIVENQTVWEELPDGVALGMGPFYWAIVALVVGLSGSVAVSTLVDGLNGVTPWEMGPSLKFYPPTGMSRLATFALKLGIVIIGAAGASGLMMLAGAMVDVPMPNGGTLFLVTWLGIVTFGAATLSLITVMGSAGMLVAMFYLVFMGLPSAGAVSPPEALPGFFHGLSQWEPLHYLWLCTRDVFFFDAKAEAGLGTGVLGLLGVLAAFLVLAVIVSPLWDRISGRRGLIHGTGKHAAV
ncbi:DUF3533 domain-containing protein [Kocuria palustris]|uniref:YhgE/Pip domain-containing protein n=1 Tax=Kocuria palustris TaxID=71999 RepID=UPI000A6EF505|nr:DUF3533 domain-containing protein [Kocuria palustris]